MKLLTTVAVLATFAVSPAAAFDRWNGSGFSLDHQYHSRYDNMFRYNYNRSGGNITINSAPAAAAAPPPPPPTKAERAADDRAADAADRKWERYCEPVKNVDDQGVVFLTYAHKGCEFGRSE